MTQQQRAQVWARKDQLFKALAQIPTTDKRSRNHITEQIEACNQALVQNKYELLPQAEE